MTSLRRFLIDRPWLALALVVLALSVKFVVPAGFMPTASAGGIAITICSGTGPMTMVMPSDTTGHAGDEQKAKPDAPCAFAGLALPSLGGADPIQLALALAFVLAIGLASATVWPRLAVAHLRPPLRGPPALA